MSRGRIAELFHVLKIIRLTVEEWRTRAAEAVDATPPEKRRPEHVYDQQRADRLRAAGDVDGLHALCVHTIVDRECAVTALDAITVFIRIADIAPRTRNLGPEARARPQRRSLRSSCLDQRRDPE